MAWLDSQDKNTGRAAQAPLAPTLRAKERLAPTLRQAPRAQAPRSERTTTDVGTPLALLCRSRPSRLTMGQHRRRLAGGAPSHCWPWPSS